MYVRTILGRVRLRVQNANASAEILKRMDSVNARVHMRSFSVQFSRHFFAHALIFVVIFKNYCVKKILRTKIYERQNLDAYVNANARIFKMNANARLGDERKRNILRASK
jgi:phage gp29-like protein